MRETELRFADRILEAAMGDCFEANGKFFMSEALFGADSSMRLVHGEVTGQGALEGVNYGHCWIEDGGSVIDVSNGRNIKMSKDDYYERGSIATNNNMHKYGPRDFQKKILKHEHWGPWNLKTSTGL